MPQPEYVELLAVMKKRGGSFAGMDIPEFFAMAEVMFTPAEAQINNAMPKGPFTANALATQMGRDEAEVSQILNDMADKGLCQAVTMEGIAYFQSARLMPGIFEFQFMSGRTGERDKKLAHLIHDFKQAYQQKAGIVDTAFPTTRVITVDRTIQADNQVHTYDQVQTFIDKYDQIAVGTCYCRHAAALRGEDTHEMPNEVCMNFGIGAQFAVERLNARPLTKAEAREVLEISEEAGLIHMSLNMTDDIGFICNCDRWHCFAVANALAQPKPGAYFNSGFEPQFDADKCVACETCVDRCPPEALAMGDGDLPVLDLDRCFGCAVCATGCPSEAIAMVNKPDFPAPPKDAKELKAAIKASLKSATS